MQVFAMQIEPGLQSVSTSQLTQRCEGRSQSWSFWQSDPPVQPTWHAFLSVQYCPEAQMSSFGVQGTHANVAGSQTGLFVSLVQSAETLHSGPAPPAPPAPTAPP